MPIFTVQYELTERTIQHIEIEAESAAEAIELVEQYQFDNSEAREIDSIEWSLDNIRAVGEA